MLQCFLCSRDGFTFKLLKHHVRIRHSHVRTSYTCQQNNCCCTFNSLRAVYSHIRFKHKDLLIEHTHVPDNRALDFGDHRVESDVFLHQELQLHDDDTEDVDSLSTSPELSYVLRLYQRHNLSRTDINEIINNTIELIGDGVKADNLRLMDSEYKRKNVLVDKQIFIEPKTIVLGYKTSIKKVGGKVRSVRTPITGQYTSIDELILMIFRSPLNLKTALDHLQHHHNSKNLYDVKDGEIFHSYEINTIPFCLYYDEVEVGNPLGSHKGYHKVGAVYFSLRCFPTHVYSSLKHIQHCVLFPARDRSNLDKVINMLVPHLTRLSTVGICIHGKQFRFQFIGFIGDNLGLHQVLGFSESFSANYFCRFCRTHKATTKNMTQENS